MVLESLAGIRILVLNWRDTGHPDAGGAEVYCEEITTRFAAAGAEVTLFTAAYAGAPMCEYTRGHRTLRQGGRLSVYAAAARYLTVHQGDYDAVVDFQNGIPFFSPAFARRLASVCVVHHVHHVHHVHQDQFDLILPYPQNVVGRILEKQVSRTVYGGRPIVAVSPSTKADIRRVLGLRGPIHVVPNGVVPLTGATVHRSRHPSLVVVGRLVPQKRIGVLIRLMPSLLDRWPDLTLDVAGTGPEFTRLRGLVQELGLQHSTRLLGYVTEARKYELLAGSWLTVVPSEAEGWGLTVLEANGVGTPAVAFDVPGLRDSIRDGVTGWLVPRGGELRGTVEDALARLGRDQVREHVAVECRRWSASFSWEHSAERLAQVVLAELARVARNEPTRRYPGDVATAVRLETADPEALETSLREQLRVTDLLLVREGVIEILLHDCDELDADMLLQRLQLHDAQFTIARRRDVLTGLRSAE